MSYYSVPYILFLFFPDKHLVISIFILSWESSDPTSREITMAHLKCFTYYQLSSLLELNQNSN